MPTPDKDPTTYAWVTYVYVAGLAAWGGLVSWLRKRRAGEVRPFNFMELVGELVTSAFAGVITFWLCEYTATPPLITAALVGISGHMGSRAIFQLEKLVEKKGSL